jgi:hypothetical protein
MSPNIMFRSLGGVPATEFHKLLYFTVTCDHDVTKQAASVICWRYAELNVNEFFTLHNDE